MSMGPQYTSCVEPADFTPLSTAIIATLSALIVVGGLTALFTFGIGALIAIASLVQLLRYVLDFMLNGKLICLHRSGANACVCSTDGGTVCAIGEVADTEDVGEDKNPFEDVDNDYAMNVVLAPFSMSEFAKNGVKVGAEQITDALRAKNYDLATISQPQGDLLQKQIPPPVKADGDFSGSGYYRTMVMTMSDGKYYPWSEIIGRDYDWAGLTGPDQHERIIDYLLKNAWMSPVKFPVPTLHCEFEGTRIRDMLNAIEAFSLGGKWCKSNFFTRALCAIMQTIFSPIALIAVGVAWANARDGNAGDALPGGGTISSKDQVVLKGRWAYDGGHTGWSEIHATRIVQKIDYIPTDVTSFEDFRKRWCDRLSEVPHVDSDLPPADRPPLTPAQQTIHDNQQRPENQWTLHPSIDGCEPEDSPLPPIR